MDIAAFLFLLISSSEGDEEGHRLISIAISNDGRNQSLTEEIKRMIGRYLDVQEIAYEIFCFTDDNKLLTAGKQFELIMLFISGIGGEAAGKDIARKNPGSRIICITDSGRYLEYALNEMHAFACLEMPLDEEKVQGQLMDVLHALHLEKEEGIILKFKVMDIDEGYHLISKIMFIRVNDIWYFEYANRKIFMKVGGRKYFFYGTMYELQRKMQPYDFFSCHQKYLVNMRYISQIKGYSICLVNNERIPLAQKRSVEFRKRFSTYAFE